MRMNELISVIIPAFNAEKTLGDCLDSVLNQSYRKTEVLVIDDGSSDNTYKIAETYRMKDSRIKVFRKENGGQSSARNLGLKRMTGSLFLYVDSDDEVMPEMIERLYKRMSEEKADISMCGMICKTEKNETRKYCDAEILLLGRDEIIRQFLAEKFAYGPVCKLFRAEIFGKIPFKEGIIFEDIEYLSRVYLESNSICTCDYPGYIFWIRSESTTHSKFDDKKLDLLKVTEMISQRIQSENIVCDKEMMLFVLNSYLSILLMAADSGDYRRHAEVCRPLTAWIRENRSNIRRNELISERKKLYTYVFRMNNLLLINLLAFIRR